MKTGQSQVNQVFSLIEELTRLDKQPRRGVDPGFFTLEVLTDDTRTRMSGILVEAKMLLDKNLGRANQFSQALAMLGAKSYPMPLEVQDLLQRALRYMDTSEAPPAPTAMEVAAAAFAPVARPPRPVPNGAPAALRSDYVHAKTLSQLRQLPTTQWDLRRLIRLCEELNIAHRNDCTMTIGMLLRAIKDHCAPVFGCTNFSQVANNATGISQSMRGQLKRLDTSLKDIADRFLHEHIRPQEALPSPNQVAFVPELDALLGEIVVAVKRGATP